MLLTVEITCYTLEMFFVDIPYTKMAEKLSEFKTNILQCEDEIRTYEHNLERLNTDYQKSKVLRPIQRYATMKVLIKDVIQSSPSL